MRDRSRWSFQFLDLFEYNCCAFLSWISSEGFHKTRVNVFDGREREKVGRKKKRDELEREEWRTKQNETKRNETKRNETKGGNRRHVVLIWPMRTTGVDQTLEKFWLALTSPVFTTTNLPRDRVDVENPQRSLEILRCETKSAHRNSTLETQILAPSSTAR